MGLGAHRAIRRHGHVAELPDAEDQDGAQRELRGLPPEAREVDDAEQERDADAEVAEVEEMYKRERIPWLDSTKFSIEEISTKVLSAAGLHRKI